jgi:putative Holliday junction resolvase
MRLMGLDIGERRIGVAISDATHAVATPLTTLDADPVMRDGGELVHLVEEWEVEGLVIGLPFSLDGSEGPQAARIRSAAERLARFVRVPIMFADERLTSAEAARRMSESGVSTRRQRPVKDMLAATLFLQMYIDASREGRADSKGGLE